MLSFWWICVQWLFQHTAGTWLLNIPVIKIQLTSTETAVYIIIVVSMFTVDIVPQVDGRQTWTNVCCEGAVVALKSVETVQQQQHSMGLTVNTPNSTDLLVKFHQCQPTFTNVGLWCSTFTIRVIINQAKWTIYFNIWIPIETSNNNFRQDFIFFKFYFI